MLPQALLDGPGEFLDGEAARALDRWERENNRSVELGLPGLLAGGTTNAPVLTVIVREASGPDRKVLLKRCPPGSRLLREAGAHRRALQAVPEFSVAHLVDQPWDPVLLPDGGCLMFQDLAQGGLDRTRLLVDELVGRAGAAACGQVTSAVLERWNPRARTASTTAAGFVAPQLSARLKDSGKIHRWAAAHVPGLWEATDDAVRLPDGTSGPNPLVLARGGGPLAAVRFHAHVGNAHGDLHAGNVLLARPAAGRPLDDFRLIDLASFGDGLPLAHDPMTLLLSVVHAWLPRLVDEQQRDVLLRALSCPDGTDDAGWTGGAAGASAQLDVLPTVLADAVAGVHTAGEAWAEATGFGAEWRLSTRLAVMSNALLYVGWSAHAADQWWYWRLAVTAAASFATTAGASRRPLSVFGVAEPAGTVRAAPPRAAPAPTAPVPILGRDADGIERASRRTYEASIDRAGTRVVARAALENQILPRVRRRLQSGDHAPVLVAGEAGIGKSVLCAQLYDRLAADGTAFPLLVNCEHLLSDVSTAGELDVQLGLMFQSGGGGPQPISVVAGQVAELHGVPAVVILDTVDYILGKDSARAVLMLLRQLRDQHVTVVLTCRRNDFDTWLQPGWASLAVPREQTEVPPLTRGEVEAVVRAHVQHRGLPAAGDGFVGHVLAAFDEQGTLADLVVRPLLLIMMCELFAEPGFIPADLSTTRLCARYYQDKVVANRRYSAGTPESRAKQDLSFHVSAMLWDASLDLLSSWVPENELRPDSPAAFQDLLSETVLVRRSSLSGSQIGFRHQALTEYFIALHLYQRAAGAREHLLAELRENPHSRWFAWQIVRHIVSMADGPRLPELLDSIDLSSLPAFRAVAFGAVEAHREGLLSRLVAHVRTAGDEFTAQLVAALPAVPADGLAEAQTAAADLLAHASPRLVSAVARAAGELAVRDRNPDSGALAVLLRHVAALASRSGPSAISRPLLGAVVENLVEPYVRRGFALPRSALDTAATLIGATKLGPPAVRELAKAFLIPGTAQDRRVIALQKVLGHIGNRSVGETAADLAVAVVPWARGAPTGQPEYDDPLAFLTAGGKNSEQTRAQVCAKAAALDPALGPRLYADFCSVQDGATARRLLLFLQESVVRGQGAWVAALVTGGALPGRPGGAEQMCALLNAFVTAAGDVRYALADWLASADGLSSRASVDTFLRLVRDHPDRLRQALPHLAALTEGEQHRVLANLARERDGVVWSAVVADAASAGSRHQRAPALQARIYSLAADEYEPARQMLLALVGGPSRKGSDQALYQLELLGAEPSWLTVGFLTPLSDHPEAAVRRRGAGVVTALVRRDRAGDTATVTGAVLAWLGADAARAARGEPAGAAEQAALLDMVHTLLRDGTVNVPGANDAVAALLDRSTKRLGRAGTVPVRSLVALLKTLSAAGPEALRARVADWIDATLRQAEVVPVPDAVEFVREGFGHLAEESPPRVTVADVVAWSRKWPGDNRIVAARLVMTHDGRGPSSPYLDELLAMGGSTAVEQLIVSYRHP